MQTVHISKLSHDGRGLAHVDGKATFVFGALPGEEVSINYTKKRSKFDEAATCEILKSSLERAEPACKFFGTCGGCNLQHLDQTSQISFKQSVLLEQLLHFGKVQAKNILEPLVSDPYGYRRKARYSVRHVAKKERVLIGFRELHQPRFLADIDSCQVLHPHIGLLIKPLQDCLINLENKKHIAQIEAGVGDNATALIFRHLELLSAHDQDLLVSFAKKFNIWLFLQPGGYKTIHKVYPKDDNNLLTYNITNNLILYFHPSDFTQINYNINRQMITQALKYMNLNDQDIVLDLFCGIGNFSLPLAQSSACVFGIEGEAVMVERARMNAERNNISNAYFAHVDLNQPELVPALLSNLNYNKILIDPPRSGARPIVEKLDLSNVELIVYISCNPASLARDAGILAERGFVLEHVGVMDMFTHTEHVEAMAVFAKNK
jgi:23S rRNA (uracil1939-C5)-methyltransferase